jgi:hypothetical protein
MPNALRARIVTAYNLLPDPFPNGENPIKRFDLIVSGIDNEVHLT